jgi:hypothetical protein
VLLSLGGWMAAHLLLLAAIALPAYQACLRAQQSCGTELGLTALAIGWIQPFYGIVIALILRRRQRAVAQGILTALGVTTLLFTVLCFGGAARA